MSLQTLRVRKLIARFLKWRKSDKRAHIVSAVHSLSPYRVQIEDAGLRFQPEVLCDRRI